MIKVSLNHHLVKVKGIYHYRARVPKRLVEILGIHEIKYSLDTKDMTVARRLRNVAGQDSDSEPEHRG